MPDGRLAAEPAAAEGGHGGAAAREASPLPTLSLKRLESIAMEEAMRQTRGSIADAAALLEISKATLYRKLKDA